MKQVYLLINCNAGTNKALIEQMVHINGVKEVYVTYSAFDIIVKIKEQKGTVTSKTIIRKIRQIEHIKSTRTLICLDTGEHKSFLTEIIPDTFIKFPTWF